MLQHAVDTDVRVVKTCRDMRMDADFRIAKTCHDTWMNAGFRSVKAYRDMQCGDQSAIQPQLSRCNMLDDALPPFPSTLASFWLLRLRTHNDIYL